MDAAIIDEVDSYSDSPAETSRGRKILDISGMVFGRWHVIDLAPGAKQPAGRVRTMWNCVCECGYKARVACDTLMRGRSKSCGCLKSDLGRMRAKSNIHTIIVKVKPARRRKHKPDITDETFGRWTVLGPAQDQRDASGQNRRVWSCRCDCGTEKVVLGTSLQSGKSLSCGCLRKEILPEARRQARQRRQKSV